MAKKLDNVMAALPNDYQKSIEVWAIEFARLKEFCMVSPNAKTSWSSNRAHQAALEFMVDMLAKADLSERSVTLPNQDLPVFYAQSSGSFMQG